MNMHLPHYEVKKHEISLRDRFIVRVLLPPFIMMIAIGGIGFWQLNNYLTNEAVNELRVAATATAVRLDREISIRESVLVNTGEEIASVKDAYVVNLAALERDRRLCREHYSETFTFTGSPEKSCEAFTTSAIPSLAIIEDIYIESAKNLQNIEVNGVNQRLSAFKQFFPETISVMVVNTEGKIISSAVSGDALIDVEDFVSQAVQARTEPIRGQVTELDELSVAVFAFAFEQGSVLATYDVNNQNYIDPSWQSTPINAGEASALIIESQKNVVYPDVRDELEILSEIRGLDGQPAKGVNLSGVDNIIVFEDVGNSDWEVAIASPEAIVLGPVRDIQFLAFAITGLVVIGFLWVGTFFIKKMTDNIAMLVTGAMVYGSGRLDYKMDMSSSEKELKQLADTMTYMAKRIATTEKENDERNKEFISIATHELRAPMTSIIGYLSMLKENQAKKITKKDAILLDGAYDSTTQLRDLVTDMLDAARLEGGREEFIFTKIDTKSFIEERVDSMKVVAKQAKISLKYDSKGSEEILADEAKLRIVLNNFLSNALKYNHKSGHVRITHSKHKDQLVTEVANTGPVIPDDQKKHMFEKFFRVDTPEHRKITGTGVGMFVTKQYVLAMGGQVWFESEKGKDTVFYFSLPLATSTKSSQEGQKITPRATDSKWIMRWRRHVK